MLRNNPARRQTADVSVALPLPKLTPKILHTHISRELPTLVRKGQEHVLDEPGPVVFMGLSQILDTFYIKLSTVAAWYYSKEKSYPLVVTSEMAFELAHIIRQTEEEEGGFGALLKRVGISNDLVPEELELGLCANAELETIVFDAWREVVGTISNMQYSHSGRVLLVEVRGVASALARAGKGLETYVMTTAPEVVSLVKVLGTYYPLSILGSDVPATEYYGPALKETNVLLTEKFVAALPSAEAGSFGIFKDVEVIAGSGIKKLVGFKVSPPSDSDASVGDAYINVPIFPVEQALESLPLLNSHRFLVYKPAEGMPPRLVGHSVMQLNRKGELVDTSGNYKSIPLGSYLKGSGISSSPSDRETVRRYLAKQGMVIPRPLSYAVIDDATIASNLNL